MTAATYPRHPQPDKRFETRIAQLHAGISVRTTVKSRRFIRHTRDNSVLCPTSFEMKNPSEWADRPRTITLYNHEETCVEIDASNCCYLIFFRYDGTVDSQVFA